MTLEVVFKSLCYGTDGYCTYAMGMCFHSILERDTILRPTLTHIGFGSCFIVLYSLRATLCVRMTRVALLYIGRLFCSQYDKRLMLHIDIAPCQYDEILVRMFGEGLQLVSCLQISNSFVKIFFMSSLFLIILYKHIFIWIHTMTIIENFYLEENKPFQNLSSSYSLYHSLTFSLSIFL